MKTWMVVALPLVLACGCARAQQVIYTCAGKEGARILQDTPCADAGLRQLAARSFAAPRDPPDAARRLEAIDRQVHAEWAAERRVESPRARRRVVANGTLVSRRDRQRAQCDGLRARVQAAARSRHPRRDRGQLEDDAIDACFAL
ncbi:MAG TPA: hypothetical protein VLM17_03240 [Xanthomonadaceae bacterium]|nr:hypothetical protein [Xanthomonadaceae bacterium]